MIALDNVTKRFNAVTAVDRVSFRAEKGKFVVLLGPAIFRIAEMFGQIKN